MTKRKLLENIYDVVKVCALSEKQTDDYADLAKKHAREAIKELNHYLKDKYLELNLDYLTFSIGKFRKLKLS